MFRFMCLLAVVAVSNAGIANYNGAAVIAPTYTSEHQNVLRSPGNLQQVSYQSKTIDTPYSSVSKSDVRVSNPGIQVAQVHQPLAYAAHSYHAPAAYAAPAAYHQASYAPATAYHAPAAYHHAQPLAYSAPHHQVVAAPATKLIGVAYSPSTSVSHMSYSAPLISYAW